MKIFNYSLIIITICIVSLTARAEEKASHPTIVSVLDFGAVGDGIADDTEAIQRALDKNTAEVVFPAGAYRITKTLYLGPPRPTKPTAFRRLFRGEGVDRSVLVWDGEAGGTLFWARSMFHCAFHSLSFYGQSSDKAKRADQAADPVKGRAGVLFQCQFTGGGNMYNYFQSCRFAHADVGLKMGTSENEATNSDILFSNTLAYDLGTFFWTASNQAVDYTFNFLFVYNTGTALRFERGGNLLVNSLQATDCDLILGIEGGARNCTTYTLNNVRLESARGGFRGRFQLLNAKEIHWEQALVTFTGFDDVLYGWALNKGEDRDIPLCEIGPGVNVTFQSSSFEGPVARLTGKAGKPASLVIRESTFGFINPHEAISANEFGQFKTINCFTDTMQSYPDISKWPDLPSMSIPLESVHEVEIPQRMESHEKASEENLKRREKWIDSLRRSPSVSEQSAIDAEQ